MALNNIEITEQLFEAIDTIIEQRIRNLPFDRTVTATIVDISMILYHKYMVTTDDNITFDAYSMDNYNLGDRVYVRIPEGDYTQQKIITGKFIPIYKDDEVNKQITLNRLLITRLEMLIDESKLNIDIMNIEAEIQQYMNEHEDEEDYEKTIKAMQDYKEVIIKHKEDISKNIIFLQKMIDETKQQLKE